MTLHKRRVGDVMTLMRRPVTVYPEKMYREIGIRSFGRGIFHKPAVSGSALGNKRVFYIQLNELIFNTVFAWEGAVSISGPAEAGMIGSHRFMTYHVDPDIADVRYLWYFFQSELGLSVVQAASPGSAGRNRTLGIKLFDDQTITLPDIEEQRRIATKLDSMLGLVGSVPSASLNQRVGIVHSIGTQLIDEIAKRHASTAKVVGDVARISHDLVRPGEDPGPATEFVGLEHIEGFLGRKNGSRRVGDEKGRKFRFVSGDVLYGYLRPYQNKVWFADRAGLCSVEQYVLRFASREEARYAAYVLRGRSVLDRVNELTNNLQLPRLRSQLLLGLEIPWGNDLEIRSAIRELDKLHRSLCHAIDLIRQQASRTDALRPALLNAAFSGQL